MKTMQKKLPTSNNGTIAPDSYGVSTKTPRNSTLDMKTGKVEGRDIANKVNWGRNGGYYKQ